MILLPLFEFLSGSSLFRRVFASTLVAEEEDKEKKTATRLAPLPLTILSLSSYLLSHASSSSSARAIAYANLALSILLVMVESDEIMAALREPSKEDVRLCRQVCSDGEVRCLCAKASVFSTETASVTACSATSCSYMRRARLLCAVATA